jgi:pimeloyl-ACP methyl ester carboxylesterase
MPFASANGIDIYYELHGAGEPLVMIAGLGSDHTGFVQLQVPAFGGRFQCVLLDNRGIGRSGKPDAPYATWQMADDVAALLDAIGLESAHVAGWSMGGAIAQHLALRHPHTVRSLQLHCTWPRTDRFLAWQLERRRVILTKLGREELYRHVMLSTFTPRFFEEHLDQVEATLRTILDNPDPQPIHAYLRQLDACIEHDAEAGLERIRVPTLITVGDQDPLIAPRFAHRLKERIPPAELVVLEDAAHGHSLEQTERFNAVCLDFLARRVGVAA